MNQTIKLSVVAILGAVIALTGVVFYFVSPTAQAAVNNLSASVVERLDINTRPEIQRMSFFVATTTTATSTNTTPSATVGTGAFTIAGADNVTFYFSRGGATGPNTGSTVFKVQVTPDGTNWYDYNTLRLNAATSTISTLLSSVTVPAGTSTQIVYMDTVGFLQARCIAVETTDGDHTCVATAEFKNN